MTRWEEKMFKHIEDVSDDYINIKDFQIGKVISSDPLEIYCNGLPLYENNLYINTELLENTKEFTTLTGTIGGNETTISNGSITFKTQLKKDDYVILREMEDNKYVLLFKISGIGDV